jgi:transposase-like protein
MEDGHGNTLSCPHCGSEDIAYEGVSYQWFRCYACNNVFYEAQLDRTSEEEKNKEINPSRRDEE